MGDKTVKQANIHKKVVVVRDEKGEPVPIP